MNTNQILKKVVSNIHQYRKQQFVKMLNANIEMVNPIDFTNLKYQTANDLQTLFLFINDQFKVIGILQGATPDIKRFGDYLTNDPNKYKPYTQNWKQLQPISTYVLGLTANMRGFHINDNNRKDSKKTIRQHEIEYWTKYHTKSTDKRNSTWKGQTLATRLQNYKANKYSNITLGDVLSKIQMISSVLVGNIMATPDVQAVIYQRCKKLGWSCSQNNVSELFRVFADEVKDFIYRKNQYDQYFEAAKKYGDSYLADCQKVELESSKVRIIAWYKAVCM